MWAVVVLGFEHHGQQSHPGDRVWLPLAQYRLLASQGYVRPDETVRHRDPVVAP